MFDRSILSRSVHCLKDEEDGPLILRVKHVLQFCKDLDTLFQELLCSRFVFGGYFASIAGTDILKSKFFPSVTRYGLMNFFDRSMISFFFILLVGN